MKTILVADDEPNIRRLIQINLEHAGYRVETAENGQQAWERLQQGGIDLVVTDTTMLVMDGYELRAAMERDPILSTIPCLLLSDMPRNLREQVRKRLGG